MKELRGLLYLVIFLLHFSLPGICQTDANTPIHGITICIDYPDAAATVSAAQLDSILNGITYQETGIQRTFRKYWLEQTRRNVVMHQDVFFYTAPFLSTYYESIGWQAGILLWKDALESVIVNNPSYNWDALSPDEAGGLRSVMIISSKWGPAGVGGGHGPYWTLSNEVKVNYIYGSVLKAPWDVSNNLFMTLHESGHGIFHLPDTYDTEYDSGGTWFYTLMSGGMNDVEPVGGPFLAQHNWGHVIEPGPGTHTITLKADGDSIVVFRNLHDSLEFFTIEARKQSTMGNSLFPVELGLLIWHSDTKVPASNTLQDMTPMKHYAHSIEQADGLFELESFFPTEGNAGDIYLPGNSFNDGTSPDTKWWDQSVSGIDLGNIQLSGSDQISFTVTIPEPHAGHFEEIPQAGWSLVSATPSQAGYNGTKAFDGDLNTYYHVPWGNNYPRPHEIVIDLGKPYVLNEFYYTANKNNVAPWEGRIEDYNIYISTDTVNWGTAVASGTFFQTGIRQYVLFANTTGRYIKFSALSSFNDDVRTSIAEINLRGYDPSVTSVPDPDSDTHCTIYPNPSNGQFTVFTAAGHAEIVVTDLQGQEILKTMATHKTTNLHLDHNGVYIVFVKIQQGTAAQRIVVNR